MPADPPQEVVTLSDTPPGTRKVQLFLRPEHIEALDREILRRKIDGQDLNAEGVRINVNRSLILRELIEQHVPMPKR